MGGFLEDVASEIISKKGIWKQRPLSIILLKKSRYCSLKWELKLPEAAGSTCLLSSPSTVDGTGSLGLPSINSSKSWNIVRIIDKEGGWGSGLPQGVHHLKSRKAAKTSRAPLPDPQQSCLPGWCMQKIPDLAFYGMFCFNLCCTLWLLKRLALPGPQI